MNATWFYTAGWLGAAALAFGLAFAAPNEASVMGRLPDFMSRTLGQKNPVTVPDGLPSDRTLALITFQKEQRSQAETWITGLNLRNDPSITWMRMPVINDPGDIPGRHAVENKLLNHYPADAEQANLVPVFIDKARFARSAGLSGPDHVFAVVLNRNGDVLARAEGAFDASKAESLLETLKAGGGADARSAWSIQSLSAPSVK
jgi:hypothetical protein